MRNFRDGECSSAGSFIATNRPRGRRGAFSLLDYIVAIGFYRLSSLVNNGENGETFALSRRGNSARVTTPRSSAHRSSVKLIFTPSLFDYPMCTGTEPGLRASLYRIDNHIERNPKIINANGLEEQNIQNLDETHFLKHVRLHMFELRKKYENLVRVRDRWR